MSGDPLKTSDGALVRLTGGLLIASGLMIATLCGGCTLTLLRQPNPLSPLVLFIGGTPTAMGVFLVGFGWQKLRLARSPASTAPAERPLLIALGWGLIGLGALIAIVATFEIALDAWLLVNALTGALADSGGAGGLAFLAALEHALLFLLAAAVLELGRRLKRRRL